VFRTKLAYNLTDPVEVLPTELSSLILSYLEPKTLVRVIGVSRRWKELATSNPVWRSAFLNHYSASLNKSTGPYIQMGGQGLGQDSYGPQQWQKMAEARSRIEDNWKQQSPKAIYFSGHTDSVYCCQFDEDKIITGSRDRTVRVWEINPPYRCLKVLGGPAAKPQLSSQDDLYVHENTVSNLPTINGTLEGDSVFHVPQDYHSASILCLQYDDEIMVTGSSDFTCIVWDMKTYEPIKRLRHHSNGVLDVCFDDTYIISCSKDFSICVWLRSTMELVKQLKGHTGPVNAVQLRKVGGKRLLVSVSVSSARMLSYVVLPHTTLPFLYNRDTM
jgi:F-box and WD-40 domain protein 1/11